MGPSIYINSFGSQGSIILYKNIYKKCEKKSRRKHWRNKRKRQKVQAKENLDNVCTGKVDNFLDQQIFSSTDEFQLKVLDQILVIFHLEKKFKVKTRSALTVLQIHLYKVLIWSRWKLNNLEKELYIEIGKDDSSLRNIEEL